MTACKIHRATASQGDHQPIFTPERATPGSPLLLVAAQQDVGTVGRFAVVADGPATSRPIKLLGVDSIVALFPTFEEALADVAAMQ